MMSWKLLVFVVFAGFTVMVNVVPGILMAVRGRAPSVYRYVTIGWRWVPVDLTPDETRTVGQLHIAKGVLWPCVVWVILFFADGSVPAALTWLFAAAAVAAFGWTILLGRRVRRLPSVVEASSHRSR
jgi:hypothetical protein